MHKQTEADLIKNLIQKSDSRGAWRMYAMVFSLLGSFYIILDLFEHENGSVVTGLIMFVFALVGLIFHRSRAYKVKEMEAKLRA